MIAHPTRLVARLIVCVILAVSVTACSTAPASRSEAAKGRSGGADVRSTVTVGERAARIALDQVGTPYRYGGQSPSTGFDCSGLVHYAYGEAGQVVPRTTKTLWSGSKRISENALEPGDLVFFRVDGKMQHVGLYLGDGRFVHAPSTGRTVSVESLYSPFYRQALLSGGRLD